MTQDPSNHDQKNSGPVLIELDEIGNPMPESSIDDYPHWEDEIPEYYEGEEPLIEFELDDAHEKLREKLRPDLTKIPFYRKADITLSGSRIEIGSLREAEGDCIFLRTDEIFEPIYMSVTEARLLIAALQASISEGEND